ncbi:LacI family DNA-binding transcriptional regulator [Alkalibacterium olivapovliticus]|uniref:DNA-binding LacI/PurR family transcriptional regulator n=1 Tax=Alkalibacterium olivapovliticus TaxID=99907 RepID=A0A2T0WAB8_9LACT|nr:LacI family DNA-binding transcriptional regulator [Alkalibacterium olivapovliticus]PRY83650.1 DNA-binding LacI/PurR family transcriptional regulator [Alkalibacterium olivapovliticus]
MPTILDIAEYAGVSSATVSRVINSSGYVGEETRKLVEEAIEKLNYSPNKNAQHLRKGSTKNFGIISTQFNDTAVARINSFITTAYSFGYTTTLFVTNGDKKREVEAFDLLKSKQIDGIFLIYRANDWSVLEKYAAFGPVVTLHNVDSEQIPSVFIDHYEGHKLALEYLWETGCRHIYNLYGTATGLNTKRRIQAYHDFCDAKGIPPHPSDPFIHTISAGKVDAFVSWFLKQQTRPDAVVTHSDSIAALVVSRLRRKGIAIPEEVSVIGFDNIDVSDVMDMSTIDYGIEEQGRNACRLLLQKLAKPTDALGPLSFKLIQRKTTR